MSILDTARAFAKEAHGTQERKFTGEPYVKHLEETAQLLWGATDGEATNMEYVAAVLHDVVEDTPVELAEVGRNFGSVVMDLVEELTIDPVEKEKLGKRIYLSQKINSMTTEAFTIKLCDRLSNVVGLEDRRIPVKFVKYYLKETKYLLKSLDRGELTEPQSYLLERINSMLIYLEMDRKIK